MIDIFIIDDHLHLNKGIEVAFAEEDYGINVVGFSTSSKEGLQQLERIEVDVVILDIVMPEMDGIMACKLIKEQFPEIKVIAFTGELDPNKLLSIWREQVDGILNKVCGTEALAKAIKRVMLGMRIKGKGVPSFLENIESDTGHIPRLTKTEQVVLEYLGTGLTRKEVAEEMNRSMYSVEFHIKNMYKKFNTNRLHLLLAEARKARFIKLSSHKY